VFKTTIERRSITVTGKIKMATQLNYAIEPSQVFVSTTTDLSLTVSNPVTAGPVVFAGGRDPSVILITIPVGSKQDDLTAADTFTVTTASSGFAVSKKGQQYQISASQPGGATLNPGESIVVTVTGLAVASDAGLAQLAIEEFIGEKGIPASVGVNKVEQGLGVYAWLDPLTVGEGQSSTLRWQSTGGTQVTIAGSSTQPFPDSFPVKGDPPHSDCYQVDAPVGVTAQTVYTVKVFATGKSATASPNPTLTKHIPVITTFDLAQPTTEGGSKVGPTEKVALTWTSVYATGAYFSGPSGQQQWYTNPSSSQNLLRQPGVDLYHATQNKLAIPNIATYQLSLSGYDPTGKGQSVAKSFSLDVQKVALGYFKYATNDAGKLSGVEFETIPSDWPGRQVTFGGNTEPSVLTIYQPGACVDTYYLGPGDDVHPQIQYFAATAGHNAWTLNWITANLEGLTLNGAAQSDVGRGCAEVTTAGSYRLVGTAANGQTVQSVLLVS
jgi:hypothetical protein